jgi:transcriptional regulator with XRE-family HTH domain
MKLNRWIKEKIELYKDDFEFRFETLILNLTENICKRMKQKNINRTELAGLLNVSPPAVTKILNGNSNFTLKTLLLLSDALGQELEINFRDKEASWTSGVCFVSHAITSYTTAYSDESLHHYPQVSGGSVSFSSQLPAEKDWVEAA